MACTNICCYGLGNSGLPNCNLLIQNLKHIFVQERFASDGTRNKILSSDTPNDAYLTARINDADTSKRWYPILNIENPADTQPERIIQTFDSGNIAVKGKGARSFQGLLPAVSLAMAAKINKWSAKDLQIYVVDINDQFIALRNDGDTEFYGIPLTNKSWSCIGGLGNGSDVALATLSFSFSRDADEANWVILNDATFDYSNANGLLDVKVTYSSITTTGFNALLYTTGTTTEKVAVSGLEQADFTLKEGASTITITTVSESTVTEGLYTFVIPSQTSADILNLNATQTGLDFKFVKDTNIVIP